MIHVIKPNQIQAEMPCGSSGKKVNVHEHGVRWAVQNIIEQLDEHSKKCKKCKPPKK